MASLMSWMPLSGNSDLLVISTMTLTYTGMGVGRLNEIG